MFTFEPVTPNNFFIIARLFDERTDDWVSTPDKNWLANVTSDSRTGAAIVRQNADPIGYLQYDRVAKATFALALFISKPFRGRGLGSKVLADFLASRPANERFVAYIEGNNLLSSRAFEKAGFALVGPGGGGGMFEYRHHRS